MSETPLTTQAAEPSLPETISVTSNSTGDTVSIVNGFVRLQYYESITLDSIRASYIFNDTGGAVDGKTVREGLPLVGTEEIELKFEDNNGNVIHFSADTDNAFYINQVTPFIEEANKSMVHLSLVSQEAIRNEQGDSRINIRFDGRISDHIKNIFKDFLKSEKLGEEDENITETSNSYNFIGNGRKAFYTLNWLSKMAIPSKDGQPGDTAGFLFYETSEGYHFKSIDSFFGQEYENGKKWKKNKRRAKSIWSIEYGKTKLTPHINLIIEQLPFPYDDFRSLFVLLDRLLPYECKCLNRRNKTVDLQPVFLENGINQYITKEIKSDNKTTTILKSDFCKSDLLHHINDYFLTTNPL